MTLTVGSVFSKAMDNSKSIIHRVSKQSQANCWNFCTESMGRIVSCNLEKSEVQVNNDATGTSSHGFDKTWEWGFGPQGSLHSFMCPSLDKYSVFGAHVKSVVGLLGAAEGILSVSSDYVRMHTRGGVPILTFRWLRSEIFLIRKCAIQVEMSSLVTICQVTG